MSFISGSNTPKPYSSDARNAYAIQMGSAAAELAETGAAPNVNFVLRFFPVYDFQRQTVAALFCTPTYEPAGADAVFGHRAFHNLAPSQWAPLDCAILEHALLFASQLAIQNVIVAVGASVSFATLCDPIGRRLYRETLRRAPTCGTATLVLKIEDIPDRADTRRIADIVQCVRALVPRVWVALPDSRMLISGFDNFHASGLVLSLPPRLPTYGAWTEARWLMGVAQRQMALACVDHVDTAGELAATREAGVRFVAGHALQRPSIPASATLLDLREALYGTRSP